MVRLETVTSSVLDKEALGGRACSDEHRAVFFPASDELLNDRAMRELTLVPFQTTYLKPKRDRKPHNWITPSSYDDAMKRLRAIPETKTTVSPG